MKTRVDEPLRVMRLITRLNVGGPSYQAIFLTQRLQDDSFRTRLLAGQVGEREGSMESLAAERGVEFTRVHGLGREISPRTDVATVARLYREMRRYRPHIVHTHLAKAGAVGRLAARLARVPAVVHTYHGHVFHGYFSKRKTGVFLRIERALARWTDRLIVLSEEQEREILGFGVGTPGQMVRIPLGLELTPFLDAAAQRGQLRRELGIPEDAPLVGIVARLVPIKAHELFLEAARAVAARRPDAQFLIVGDGELRDGLEARAAALGFHVLSETGTGRRVLGPNGTAPVLRFTGFRSDLPRLYADLDVVVLCSRNEGLPVTIIEALAAARPVAATAVGAVRDLVEDGRTGSLTPPGDAAGLTDAILGLLDDPQRAAELGARGRDRVYPHLTVDRLERDIRRLYHELADSKNLRAAPSALSPR
jgi:glycosyltransferase involved in cell wall biosynthesis